MPLAKVRRKSPSVNTPMGCSSSFTIAVRPKPFSVISVNATDNNSLSLTLGIALPVRIISFTRTNKRLPILPPGCERAKSSAEKSRKSSTHTASASPSASAAVVLAVGDKPNGQASCDTSALKCTSDSLANVEFFAPVMLIIFAPRRLMVGTIFSSSSLSPEFDSAITTSPAVIIPRSPWLASAGCIKKAGVPVLARVAAIFPPTCPDLPMPLTTTRPWQCKMSCTAASKLASNRAAKALISCASMAKTLRASSKVHGLAWALGACARSDCSNVGDIYIQYKRECISNKAKNETFWVKC